MRLSGFLRTAENETDRNMDKKNRKGEKNDVSVLLHDLVGREMYRFSELRQLTSESLGPLVPTLKRFDRDETTRCFRKQRGEYEPNGYS